MALDPTIKAQLQQSIAYAAASSRDSHGDITYGSTSTGIKARVIRRPQTVTSSAGEVLVSDVQILTETAIGINDRVWLPDDSSSDATLARTPKAIATAVDEKGSYSHTVVWL